MPETDKQILSFEEDGRLEMVSPLAELDAANQAIERISRQVVYLLDMYGLWSETDGCYTFPDGETYYREDFNKSNGGLSPQGSTVL